MNNQRLRYFTSSLFRYFSDQSCPFCKSRSVIKIDRKYGVTRLFECQSCHLYFRHPKDKQDFNEQFYQEAYVEHGLTTHIPSEDLIEQYKSDNFKGSDKDFSFVIKMIKQLTANRSIRIIDYGASWGYASFQFRSAGFEVQSFEISKPMAEQGNELLQLDIQSAVSGLRPGNDVFFSAHVIEHLSDIHIMIDAAKQLLNPQGLFIAICPNGSRDYRKKHPEIYSSLWGMVHPNFINGDFYSTVFKDHPYLIASSPYKNIDVFSSWHHTTQIIQDISGEELLIACAINQVLKTQLAI